MTEPEEHHVRVFLRLRPLNRLEVNRRSRSVVEILDDERVAVEDPAEGDWEVTCDRVSTVLGQNKLSLLNLVKY
jgi:hypothetical protein